MLVSISSNINMVCRETTSNMKRKQERTCMRLFPNGTLVMGGCDWLTICVQNNMRMRRLQKFKSDFLPLPPLKTPVEIENEVFDELMYEEEIRKRPIGFGCDIDRSDVFGVNAILGKRGYTFPGNNMELKRMKEELASQKAMFLLMLKAMRNGKITDEFLDATEATLRVAGDPAPEQSSGNDLSNESRHIGPSTSASQVNYLADVGLFKTFND
ncbi:hypothetical protein Cgig2_016500 [Carnegiea gigantea]|uniref:Uncharacterized protein n=1 Tax=Carnegiea gigantea TaxID=171969 RepID=A0A9Q1JP51_9CARY|nr:hypothetical protein Cgig2_016500 [Carnegiea gigantea]